MDLYDYTHCVAQVTGVHTCGVYFRWHVPRWTGHRLDDVRGRWVLLVQLVAIPSVLSTSGLFSCEEIIKSCFSRSYMVFCRIGCCGFSCWMISNLFVCRKGFEWGVFVQCSFLGSRTFLFDGNHFCVSFDPCVWELQFYIFLQENSIVEHPGSVILVASTQLGEKLE